MSMPIFAKYNESIPEKLSNSFFDIVKDFQQNMQSSVHSTNNNYSTPDKIVYLRSLEDLSLRILNIYLHSTYVNEVRTRSSHINKVIFSYMNIKTMQKVLSSS